MICPNINHPDYKTMSKAVGPAKAHQLYAANGGQFIDKTPEGKPCDFFRQLQEQYGTDEAIRLKGIALSNKKVNDYIKPGVSELFESNPELVNAVYETLGLNIINESEITYTDEEGNPCAKMGLTNTTKGTGWKIVKDFKGKPKHSNGGVDITISDKGVTMRRGGKDIKAKYGLLIINNN